MVKEDNSRVKGLETKLNDYMPVAAARSAYENKDVDVARELLTEFAKHAGMEEKYLDSWRRTLGEEGIKHVLGGFFPDYMEALQSATVNDLFAVYSGKLEDYLGGESFEKAKKAVEDSRKGEKKYGDLIKEFARYELIIKNKELYSKEEIEEAAKKYFSLRKIIMPIREMENEAMEKLMRPAQEESRKRKLRSLYEEKDENGRAINAEDEE